VKFTYEVEHLKSDFYKFLRGSPETSEILKYLPSKVLYTGSGRAALRIILEHLKYKGVLEDRNDQVLVPRWICQSLIYTMHRFCHPTLEVAKGLKAVMVYHQYGFPQKIEEIRDFCDTHKIVLIEDCANVFGGYYKDRQMGSFGLCSIFSFSKFFPSILGGALTTSDHELFEFGIKRIRNSRYSGLSYLGRFLYDCLRDTRFSGFAGNFQEMTYALADSAFAIRKMSINVVNRQLIGRAIERRRENYLFILDYFKDRPEYFDGLEREGVVPYVLPLFDKNEGRLASIADKLNKNHIFSGVYHFDANRNILNPRFVKCVWIPVHQGLTLERIEEICKLIKQAV